MPDPCHDMIYESPDGGQTVYARPFGAEPEQRVMISGHDKHQRQQRQDLWQSIHRDAEQDSALRHMLEQVEVYYRMKSQP